MALALLENRPRVATVPIKSLLPKLVDPLLLGLYDLTFGRETPLVSMLDLTYLACFHRHVIPSFHLIPYAFLDEL